jgi:hypothetical protein
MRAPAPKGRGFLSVLAGASSIRSDGRFLDAAKTTLLAIACRAPIVMTELQTGRSVPARKTWQSYERRARYGKLI